MAVVDLAIEVNLRRMRLQRLIRVCARAENGCGIISDPAVQHKQPPVPLIQEVLDLDIVLGAAACGERRKGRAGEDLRVDLDPAGDFAVPASLVVGEVRVAVRGVEGEEVGCGDLLRVVDPMIISTFPALCDRGNIPSCLHCLHHPLRIIAGLGHIVSKDRRLQQ